MSVFQFESTTSFVYAFYLFKFSQFMVFDSKFIQKIYKEAFATFSVYELECLHYNRNSANFEKARQNLVP